MIGDRKVLALISARGGSKGLPGKNIRELNGKPLIVYSIEAALESGTVDRVVVSTDSREIAAVAAASGAEVPFIRPEELARDNTPSLPVSRHAVAWLEENEGWKSDIFLELQPVAPLRTSSDVDACVGMLVETGADTVISLCRVDGVFHPCWMKTIGEDGRVNAFVESGREYTRRQDLPAVYRRNAAVIAVWTRVLMDQETYYGPDMRGYIMPESRSVDIDNAMDLRLAGMLLSENSVEGQQ